MCWALEQLLRPHTRAGLYTRVMCNVDRYSDAKQDMLRVREHVRTLASISVLFYNLLLWLR